MRIVGAALGACFFLLTPLLVGSGCFESEEATCEYWVPKLTSATRGEKALQMVADLQCVEAIGTLDKLFDDGQYRTRIVRTLKQIGDRGAATPLLRKALLAKDTGKLAASIIGDWGIKAARPDLEQILTGPGLPKHRLDALGALLAFEKPANVEDLLIQLAGDDPNLQDMAVNKLAVEKLGEMRSTKAVPVLVKAAFLRTNKGESIYRVARMALGSIGPAAVPALIELGYGRQEQVKAYAEKNGLQSWEWRDGPEVTQLLSDSLDDRVCPALVAHMARELVPPAGVSPMAQEKWRVAQLNRLKIAMLGFGHIGCEGAIEGLKKAVLDAGADAINQRLNSATAMALIGSAAAQDALLEVWKAEPDGRFQAPMLQPLLLGFDLAHLEAFDEEIEARRAKKKLHPLVEERLKDKKIATYMGLVRECKTDAVCFVGKLRSANKDEVVKASLMLARGLGDSAKATAALLKQFAGTPFQEIDIRRFCLIALTRLGGESTAQQLLKVAENSPAEDRYWPDEIRATTGYLAAKKR